MKKILLPLFLSLLIVFALFVVASPKKIAAPAGNTSEMETSSGKSGEESAESKSDPTDNDIPSFPVKPSESGALDEGSGSDPQSGSRTSSAENSTPADTSSSSGSGNETVCTDEYAPVCGEDGRTYPNICAAGRMKANATPGACANEKSDDATEATGTNGSEKETAASMPTEPLPQTAGNGLPYENSSVGYGFTLPKNSYFSGFWAQGWASHAVGISRNASPESFELAQVKVRLYKNAVLSQLKGAENGFYEDPETGTTYLLLSGSTLTVEGDRSLFSDVIDSVIKSAYVR